MFFQIGITLHMVQYRIWTTTISVGTVIRQLVSKAISPEGEIIDIFSAAGLKRPDIGILDERFLAEVRGLKHKNVAAELLQKLLNDEIKVRSTRNLVLSQVFFGQAEENPERVPQPGHFDAGGD